MLNRPQGQMDLKFHNLRLIYDTVRLRGSISRLEISKVTGMSPTSMTRIVSSLCDFGLISEAVFPNSNDLSAGRPAKMLHICRNAAYILCIDLSVNSCRAVISDMSNTSVASRSFDAHENRDFKDIMLDIKGALHQMCRESGVDMHKILACGISIAGHVNNRNGHIIVAGRFNWQELDAKAIAEEIFALPVVIENDCKAALAGEAKLKAGSDLCQNMVYLKFGTMGVGGAAMIEGRILRGTANAAGEIGHMTVLPGGEICNCGRRGCFETILSENFIIARAALLDKSLCTMDILLEAYENKNPSATKIFDEVSRFIAIAINNVCCSYNPDVVVTNGNFLERCPQCYLRAIDQLKYHLIRSIQPHIRVMTAQMGESASIYGIGEIVLARYVINLMINAPLTKE